MVIRFYRPFIDNHGKNTMIKLSTTTLEEAAIELNRLKESSPEKYKGKWCLVIRQGQTYGYKSLKTLHKKQIALNITKFDVLAVG